MASKTKKVVKKAPVKKPVPAKKAAVAKKTVTAKKPVAAKKAVAVKKPAPPKKTAAVKKQVVSRKTVAVKKQTMPQKTGAVKKTVSSGKAALAGKTAPAKPVKSSKPLEKVIKRVPPRIIRKAPMVAKAPPPEYREIDTAKAVAFAMSIAEEMKRSAARSDLENAKSEIKLTRRPTTRTQGKQTEKFPKTDLKEFRKRLLAAREKALSGADAMRATGFNESDDHEADGGDGTNQTLRLQALGHMGNINRTIQQIEEALHRIEDGTYGVCTSCGQLIRKPRLMNQPFVLTCMECQSEMERGFR